MKGQGSTEYLVILAVVLVVALIVIGLLGQFTGFGKQGKIQQSRNYWSGTQPFAILDVKLSSTTGSQMVLKNQEMKDLHLKKIEVKPAGDPNADWTPIFNGDVRFAAGEQKVIDLDDSEINATSTAKICPAAKDYYELEVKILYDTPDMTGLTEYGQKTLYGQCV